VIMVTMIRLSVGLYAKKMIGHHLAVSGQHTCSVSVA